MSAGRHDAAEIAVVRRAIEAGRVAAHRGFLREGRLDWLIHRAMTAALRTVGRSGIDDPWGAVQRHVFPVLERGIDVARLPRDGSWLTISDLDLVEALEAGFPDFESDELESFRRTIELSVEPVLRAVAGRDDLLELGRVSHRGRDRLYRYWGGSAQDGNYELFPSTPATAERRLTEVVRALDWIVADFDPVRLAVTGSKAARAAVAQALAECSPRTRLVDWPLEGS